MFTPTTKQQVIPGTLWIVQNVTPGVGVYMRWNTDRPQGVTMTLLPIRLSLLLYSSRLRTVWNPWRHQSCRWLHLTCREDLDRNEKRYSVLIEERE